MSPRRLLLALLLGLLVPRAALANVGRAVTGGELHGPLAAQGPTRVRVDGEELSFHLTGDLAAADVSAVYTMTNAGPEPSGSDVAFVFVQGEERHTANAAAPSITADGAPIPFRTADEDELLAPRLAAWLAAHPGVERALKALEHVDPVRVDRAELALLSAAVQAAGGRARTDCEDLLRWYQDQRASGAAHSSESRRGETMLAARIAIPAEVDELRKGWSKLAEGRMTWLFFHLDFTPGQQRTVSVRYRHTPSKDWAKHVNPTFGYDYLLSPASSWASFGPLKIAIHLPEGAELCSSSLPLREDKAVRRAELAGLPDGELRFEVTSHNGLFLGLNAPAGYLALLAGLLALVTVPVARIAGQTWARASTPLRRGLLCVFGTGIAAFVLDLLVVAAASALFPDRAFGFGYDGLFLITLMVLAATLGAIVASFRAAGRARVWPAQA